MIITIDGPSGTGKSTVAKGVAKRLGFTFFDTGAMYRSFAWLLSEKGIDPADRSRIAEALAEFDFDIFNSGGDERRYLVKGTDVTAQIRTEQISSMASKVAVYPEVRQTMVQIQRKFGRSGNAVFEGRDMGTVVFPYADIKVFLTASAEVRAERRYRELLQKLPSTSKDQVLEEIKKRDHTDTTREVSPLRQAPDAILIDTSNLTATEVIDKVVSMQKKRPPMKLIYKVVYWLARSFFKCFFRLKIYGLEHFPKGPALISSNHASFYDPPVLSISCPEEVHFLARGSLFDIPLLGRLIRALNSHPVARGASDVQTFRMMIQLLEEGKKLILFPEGKRSVDGGLLPLERGLSFLVQRAKCSIIPAYLHGTFAAWPRGKKFPKLHGRMACVFGTPIVWEEFADLDKKEAQEQITRRTEQAIRDLKAWFDAGAQGNPP